MVWFFERGEETARLETRFENDSADYVLIVEVPGRERRTERVKNAQRFHARVLALEAQLKEERWTQHGQPQILPDGWRGPTT
jgi:hypothetical protein